MGDIGKGGSLDEAMKDCAGVVHVLSQTSLSPNPNDMIPHALAFANNVLNTAARTPSVKRFVYTSSQAVLPRSTDSVVVNGSSWVAGADEIIANAWAAPYTPEKAPIVYTASKICEERACWEFVEREKPGFVLNSVVPGFAIGKVMHPKLLSTSNQMTLGMLQSHPAAVGFFTAVSPTNFCSLEDIGLLHTAALNDERVNGRRLLALGERFDINRLVDLLDKLAPGSNLPPKVEGLKEAEAQIDDAFELELLKGFGREGYVGFDESVAACLSSASSGNA